MSALAYIHNILGLPDPTKGFLVKKLLYGLRRKHIVDKRLPITYNILRQLIDALPHVLQDRYKQVLFKAMFLTAFFALLRVGELSVVANNQTNTLLASNMAFQYTHRKVDSVMLTLKQFKHSHGNSSVIRVRKSQNRRLCPVRALIKYSSLIPCNTEEPLFRFRCGLPVSAQFFRQVLNNCLTFCNLNVQQFSAHSFRIGGATHAYDCKLPDSHIRLLGRWKSNAFKKIHSPCYLKLGWCGDRVLGKVDLTRDIFTWVFALSG